MGEKQLNERALELRREYQREWRRKNKEKVRFFTSDRNDNYSD